MSKRQLELSPDRLGRTAAQWGWGLALYFCLSAFLGALAWIWSRGSPVNSGITFGLAAVYAGLAMALQRGLAHTSLPHPWSYRLAFLAAAGLATLRWMTLRPNPGFHPNLSGLVIGLSGAFLGGLAITTLEGGLWENNSQPSARVQAEVAQRHRERIGNLAAPALSKRLFDITLSCFGLALSTPVWLLIVFLVWFEDPGPLLFVKNSVGRRGVNFRQLKFRTMVRLAENTTGPIQAQERDERVLWIGKLLRKTALDELPQLINILAGEMSFVGPRPQRTVLVQRYLEKIPEYADRHRVLPGLAGLAQVAGDYYLSPRQKLRFDRLYIHHAGLGFDLKLLLLAFLITFWYRWQPGWKGRLPRRLLHGRRNT